MLSKSLPLAQREFEPSPAPPAWQEIMEVYGSLDLDDLENSSTAQLDEVRSDLISALQPFDAFDIIVNVGLSNTPLNADTYRETEFEGLIAGVEVIAALLVQRGRAGTESEAPAIDAIVLDKLNTLARRALRLTSWRRLAVLRSEVTNGSDADDAMGGLRHSMLSRELFLRNPAYADQELRTIDGIFGRGQVAEALMETVGFNADHAVAITNQLVERAGEILNAEARRLRGDVEVVRDLYEGWRSGSNDVPDVLVPLFETIGAVSPKVAIRRIVETGVIGFWSQVGDTLSFIAAALSDETGIPEDSVVAFLNWFALEFGDLRDSDWESSAREVRLRPLIRDGDEYLLTVPGNLLWSIRPRLEAALKPASNPSATQRHWARIEGARKSFVEDSAMDLLETALRPMLVHRNLEYYHAGSWYEADGLMLIDTAAVVVEAKAGALTPPARRAAPKRMKSDLSKLLDDGAAQAERLSGLAAASESIRIRVSGAEEDLDVSAVQHVFSVVVTLEDLGPFSIALWELQRAEIVAGRRALPWAVSLHDLEIICDLVEFPAQLIHYMIRRRALNILQRFHASDELDLWMYYLDTGLYEKETFEGPDAPDVVALASHTDDLDAYYLWKSGVRSKTAKKPAQKMHNHFRRMLEHLDTERPSGFVEASIALLNMAGRERRMVASKLKSLKKDSAKWDRFRDMTLLYTASLGGADVRYGLTWMTGPAERFDHLSRRLNAYCQAKKYQLRAHTWFGFAAVDGRPGPFQYYMYGSFPWEEDEELDDLIEEMGLARDAGEEE